MSMGKLQTIRRIRVVVRATDADFLYVTPCTPDAEVLKVRHGVKGVNDVFEETVQRLWTGCMLNLLDVTVEPDGALLPSFMVLEPDYLLDIRWPNVRATLEVIRPTIFGNGSLLLRTPVPFY